MNKKEIIGNIAWFAGVLIVVLLVRKFIFTPVLVSGSSMDPTLADKEKVFATRSKDIERFDIVTFPAPDAPKKSYVKRVIGLPGDTVEYKNDTLYVNGKETPEPYLNEFKDKLGEEEYLTYVTSTENIVYTEFSLYNLFGSETVPEGQLFVLGDNREVSKDSRQIGFIKQKDITGKVKFIYWPPSKIGSVK